MGKEVSCSIREEGSKILSVNDMTKIVVRLFSPSDNRLVQVAVILVSIQVLEVRSSTLMVKGPVVHAAHWGI